ncbi:MAG: helix-turn-helix transcriptional regulator [Acidimicrobiales bacterium]
MRGREERLAGLAALAEPMRRRLYLLVAEAEGPVSRDDAAAAVGVSRSAAAFHLDKLTELGMLEVEFRRPPGRGGPGAGRPAKRYWAPQHDVGFSVPERRYDLVASLLAQAVEDADGTGVPAGEALRAVARDYGRALGSGRQPGTADPPVLDCVLEVLTDYGYQPRCDGRVVTMENCPFHAIAEDHRQLVCGMNCAVLKGLLEGMDATSVSAHLDPGPNRCCVTLFAS